MKKRYQLVVVFVVFAVITYLDRNSIASLGSLIRKDLSIDKIQWGFILSAFSLAYGAFEIPTGIMVDKIGPRRTMLRIVLWWSAFTILTGMVGGLNIGTFTISAFALLALVRFLFGAGEAGAFPTASVAIGRWFPMKERGTIQSIMWMGSRLGGALAPITSLWLASMYGWRPVFYIFGSLGFLWAIYWWFWFRDEPRDIAGISPEEVQLIEDERSIKKPSHKLLPWKTVYTNRSVWGLMLMYHCLLYGAYFYMSWMPVYLEEGRKIPKADLGWMTSLPFVLGMGGCLLGGTVSDYFAKRRGLTFGRRYVGMFGLIMAGICMIAGSYTENVNVAIVLLGLGLAFKDFTLPVAWATATDIGGKYAGSVAGSMGLAGQLGSVVMASAFGYLLSLTKTWYGQEDYELPVRIIGVIVSFGGLLWFMIDAGKPLVVEDED